MKCAGVGCGRELKPGDRFIRDTVSGFIGGEADPFVDGLVAEIMGGGSLPADESQWASEVVFCEDCTERGGRYRFETVPDPVPTTRPLRSRGEEE